MDIVDIAKIGIMDNGKLVVVPKVNPDTIFTRIYRADMGIEWDDKLGGFVSPLPGKISHRDWFNQIYDAVAAEMGVNLSVSDSISWENVSPELREYIENLK